MELVDTICLSVYTFRTHMLLISRHVIQYDIIKWTDFLWCNLTCKKYSVCIVPIFYTDYIVKYLNPLQINELICTKCSELEEFLQVECLVHRNTPEVIIVSNEAVKKVFHRKHNEDETFWIHFVVFKQICSFQWCFYIYIFNKYPIESKSVNIVDFK